MARILSVIAAFLLHNRRSRTQHFRQLARLYHQETKVEIAIVPSFLTRVSCVACVLIITSCAHATAQSPTANTCSIVTTLQPLPEAVRETSGLVRGRVNADVFWTHNDSGNNPQIFALGPDRAVRARVVLEGASVVDWEDIEGGPCGDGHCLYIADIGDNDGVRKSVSIYEVREPALPATSAKVTRALHVSYADGPQDAEAFFRLPDGELYVVTKGRHKSIKLYRLNKGSAQGHGTLELVRELAPQPRVEADRVTAATASPNGKWIAIRSYGTLYLYATDELLTGGGKPRVTYSLRSLGELQGESVSLDDDGTIWVTSEAERKKDLPTIGQLKCVL